MVLGQSRGAWTAARELVFSAASAGVELSALACHTASSCVAVGSSRAAASSSRSQPVVVSETAGVWGAPVQVALPAGVSGAENATFSSVACPASGSCTAAGYYQLEAAGFNPPSRQGDPRRRVGRRVGRRRCDRALAGVERRRRRAAQSGRVPGSGRVRGGRLLRRQRRRRASARAGQSHGAGARRSLSSRPRTRAAARAPRSKRSPARPTARARRWGNTDAHGGAVAPMAVSGSASGWSHAVEIASPPRQLRAVAVEPLLSVTCSGARFCLAVGGEIAASTLAAG